MVMNLTVKNSPRFSRYMEEMVQDQGHVHKKMLKMVHQAIRTENPPQAGIGLSYAARFAHINADRKWAINLMEIAVELLNSHSSLFILALIDLQYYRTGARISL